MVRILHFLAAFFFSPFFFFVAGDVRPCLPPMPVTPAAVPSILAWMAPLMVDGPPANSCFSVAPPPLFPCHPTSVVGFLLGIPFPFFTLDLLALPFFPAALYGDLTTLFFLALYLSTFDPRNTFFLASAVGGGVRINKRRRRKRKTANRREAGRDDEDFIVDSSHSFGFFFYFRMK